tara:strand:- start:890 stop:1213 length:324 start_codon:yes stop_codon:yes gene_type:complete
MVWFGVMRRLVMTGTSLRVMDVPEPAESPDAATLFYTSEWKPVMTATMWMMIFATTSVKRRFEPLAVTEKSKRVRPAMMGIEATSTRAPMVARRRAAAMASFAGTSL